MLNRMGWAAALLAAATAAPAAAPTTAPELAAEQVNVDSPHNTMLGGSTDQQLAQSFVLYRKATSAT